MAEQRKVPLYLRIYRSMRERIETGVWPAGMRLESVREEARRLGVSKFTVERVYNQLAAEGYLKAHNRSRYEVRGLPLPAERSGESAVTRPREESFVYDFGTAAMDPRGFRFSEWRPYMYRVWRNEERLLDYGDERGEWELRDALARYGADARDTKARPEDIVIGSGVQQLLRLLARLIPAEARTIHFAEEAFAIGAATFADEGYCVRSLEASIGDGTEWWQEPERYGTQLLYVVPSYTYRAEGVLPARARTELLAWAERTGGWIIEDDFGSELSYYGRPLSSLQGMSDGRRVVYIGSLSRVLPPSFRLAYMILPPSLSARYEQRRMLHRQTASVAEQLALAEYIRRGELRKQMRRLRKLYRHKGERLTAALADVFGEDIRIDAPVAGIYCTVHIRTTRSREECLARAHRAGIGLRDEPVRDGGHCGEVSFRLVFGHMREELFLAAARALRTATKADEEE